MSKQWLAVKSVDEMIASAEEGHGLKRALGLFPLTMLGIGCVIGTGIFVLTGRAAAANAGPAVALSFVLAGFASSFAALCYAEMAAMLPVAGSAYAYAYATLGELAAWIIGWDLILEYLVGAATVSVGWSGYVTAFCRDVIGFDLPYAWTHAPVRFDTVHHTFHATGAVCNAPAIFVIFAISGLLMFGVRESARVNAAIVALKVAVVLTFIVCAAPYVQTALWHPFIPENRGHFGEYGWSGVFQAATMVFFAYIGFDAVSTASQEAIRPQRDVPLAIMLSLGVCTVLYIGVSLVLTGVVPYERLSVPHPIALGVEATGMGWLMTFVEIGAIAGLSSVLLVLLMAQPRIFLAMAQDGLFPHFTTKVHPRYGTPQMTTALSGLACAAVAAVAPIEVLGELTSIGTLFAFVLVSLGIMVLRFQRPDLPRKFKVPFGPVLIPSLSVLASGTLMYTATTYTMVRLLAWMALGLAFYAAFGRSHSKLGRRMRAAAAAAQAQAPTGSNGP